MLEEALFLKIELGGHDQEDLKGHGEGRLVRICSVPFVDGILLDNAHAESGNPSCPVIKSYSDASQTEC